MYTVTIERDDDGDDLGYKVTNKTRELEWAISEAMMMCEPKESPRMTSQTIAKIVRNLIQVREPDPDDDELLQNFEDAAIAIIDYWKALDDDMASRIALMRNKGET